jgi:Na+/H+-dicarboxylate symporter
MTQTSSEKPSLFAKYHQTPLYVRIIIAMLIGVVVGLILDERAAVLKELSSIILRLLGAIAPPLILFAILNVLITTDIPKASAWRLARLLALNTLVAIFIGLFVANILQPGYWTTPDKVVSEEVQKERNETILQIIVDKIPQSLIGPFTDQSNIIGVIIIAIAFGVIVRRQNEERLTMARKAISFVFDAMIGVLHWIIELVPIGVFCVVAGVVGKEGFSPFISLAGLVVTVLIALSLQVCWYMLRIKYGSWCKPKDVFIAMRDALTMAFSTASSTATMPVTYACLREKLKLREKSASLGGLVGSNFNNDGTALYEAVAALFVAQLMGQNLSIGQQLVVVITSIFASVGAAGIPEAGIITLTLVLKAASLDLTYIPLLLTVDWFLDRCRTTVNVLGDVNVSCLLDGKTSEESELIATTTEEPIVTS